MKPRILIIDDERAICTALTLALNTSYQVEAVTEAYAGIELLKSNTFQVVLLDLRIGDRNGIEVLKEIKELHPQLAVIMMTAYGSIRSSVEAMKSGAFNYLTKPLDIEELEIFIRQALEFQDLSAKVAYLSDELYGRYQYGEMIGKSDAMQQVYSLIDKLKDVDSAVLVSGESGTGKELAARAMHYLGKRKSEQFVVVNCAAIPEGLLEEEFFGHKKGAFTGAYTDKRGKFEAADKGTIFLDEIGDMPLALQGKLLRVLQQKEFSPIGSNEVRRTNVRVVAATNRDLKKMVAAGTFRQDLYYRLNVIDIKLPRLCDRKQDIPLLCKQFVARTNQEQGRHIEGLTKAAERKLIAYPFPGNVRELSNIIEYASIVCENNVIDVCDLGPEVREYGGACEDAAEHGDGVASGFDGMKLREVEEVVIRASLSRNGGKRKATAQELGISERGLWNKIAEYGIEA